MELAPIILFCYNRPQQTQITLDALAKNVLADNSQLYIYCDGAKSTSSIESEKIAEVRTIVRKENRFKKTIVIESETNKGLSNSIIDGVTDIINKYGKAIVLEDDILTSVYFLQFMNQALDIYENDEKIFSVGACNYFNTSKTDDPPSFFLPMPDCWGWATWANRWNLFELDGAKLLREMQEKHLTEEFDLFGFYRFSNMLKDQIDGRINSWAIRWTTTCYLQQKLNVYPNPSITQHLHSLGGTHLSGVNVAPKMANRPFNLRRVKPNLSRNLLIKALRSYYLNFETDKWAVFKRDVRFVFSLCLVIGAINTYIKKYDNT